ncbi:MAG: altronate dehydratase family protein [Firmicutes bacterium]|nr:altronate dehydratase family protein [Bacillota bacterium]MDD7601034.1 altronate dehydratase family protein [Bacillota bacterium]MDY5856053.1 altronate dehydratase family protein [Anaerovoracaceae bacterium]
MKAIKLYPQDTVALATADLKRGEAVVVDGQSIVLLDDIPNAHKIALKDFKEGEAIRKYDNIIGYASRPIRKGEWIHEHNEVTGLGKSKEYTYDFNPVSIFPGSSDDTFMGYDRGDAGAGIRNHLAIISTVFCANGPLKKLAKMAEEKYPAAENFDGVIAFDQQFGCSQTGQDLVTTCKIIAGIAKNANFGGVLLVSNGCEMAIPTVLDDYLGEYDRKRIRTLTLQNVEDEFEEGMRLIDEIMAEVPEMMGAEHILMNRAASQDIFQDIVDMMYAYDAYFARYGEKAADNPTQGNKAGGLTTLEEKSLGCIQKGGHCAVMEVLKYGDRATKNGFILISGPGNDLAGVSGQIAAGAVLTLFTTGRGTPCGFAGPTFRLASNTALATRKKNWIDYDAGRLLTAKTPEEVEALNQELYDAVMATVNGEYHTRTEENGYYIMGALKDGVTL